MIMLPWKNTRGGSLNYNRLLPKTQDLFTLQDAYYQPRSQGKALGTRLTYYTEKKGMKTYLHANNSYFALPVRNWKQNIYNMYFISRKGIKFPFNPPQLKTNWLGCPNRIASEMTVRYSPILWLQAAEIFYDLTVNILQKLYYIIFST